MNNVYHKVAVASVGIALGFALGANKKAAAATFTYSFSLGSLVTFHAIDGGSSGSFDGQGDAVFSVNYGYSGHDWESPYPPTHSWSQIEKTDTREIAALLEFNFSSLTKKLPAYLGKNAKITSITNANLWIGAGMTSSALMGAFGYVGNGIAEASDFEAGVYLDATSIGGYAGWYNFNVTPFVKELLSNNNEFGGFALRSLTEGTIGMPTIYQNIAFQPNMTITGEFEEGVEPEPVPEPTTIFGSAMALGLGGWLKRKKSSRHHKTRSQD